MDGYIRDIKKYVESDGHTGCENLVCPYFLYRRDFVTLKRERFFR